MRLLSDLHMEFWQPGFMPDFMYTHSDILILAGDIAVGPAKLEKALLHFSQHNDHVIYVFGNHEYYGYNLHSYMNIDVPSNVHILNPGTVTIYNQKFVGATLWTDFRDSPTSENLANKYITDFRRIKNFSTGIAKQLYEIDLAFLKKEATEDCVIITHFLPGQHCVHPRWANGDEVSRYLNGYFAPEAFNELEVQPDLWLFGHTHDSIDIVKKGTRFISNPFGYFDREENKEFKSVFLV